jgi:hypothetical protein
MSLLLSDMSADADRTSSPNSCYAHLSLCQYDSEERLMAKHTYPSHKLIPEDSGHEVSIFDSVNPARKKRI